jgi:hypothetical protein
MGSRPVAGRPRFFGLAFIDIFEYWFSLKASRGEGRNFRPGSNPSHKDSPPMTQADSVLSTPPSNTPICQRKPMDGSRRRFLAVAAFSSVAGANSLAAAAMASLGASAAAFS